MDAQKKSWLYRERNQGARDSFQQLLAAIPSHLQVYVDEAGVEDTLAYAYGWSRQGQRCWSERLGHHTSRVSMAAAWCQGQIISPLTFEGYCHAELIEAWFEQQLCQELRPGQVVILDNAAFHRHDKLRKMVEAVGCFLLPLPSYSPDLNKIEPIWKLIKHRIAQDQRVYPSFRLKVDAAFV